MARYVAVSIYDWDKTIMGGPFELDDPSQRVVQEGQRLMLEDEALAGGWHYAEGGAFTDPGQADDKHEHGKHAGHKKHARDRHGREGK